MHQLHTSTFDSIHIPWNQVNSVAAKKAPSYLILLSCAAVSTFIIHNEMSCNTFPVLHQLPPIKGWEKAAGHK